MAERVADEFRPRTPVGTAKFSESCLYLPEEVAEVFGTFSLYYAPHLYGIFAALDDPLVPEVVCMKAAQVAWTTALIAYLSNRICNSPCAIIGLFDSDGAAKDFHDEKFVPIVEATPELGRRIDIRKTRTSGNRADFKRFPGGFLKLGGSGQIRKVKSTSAGVLFVEEPDDAKENVGNQGDAIQLLWERAKRRRHIKRIIGGTPSLKGFSQVEFRIELSDKRTLPVICHKCQEAHVLDLENVHWQNHDGPAHPIYGQADIDSAVYLCPHCGEPWNDHQRKQNIRSTVQAAIQAKDPKFGWISERPFSGIAGFHELNEAYSCLPGAGMAAYLRDKLEADQAAANGDLNKRIVFVNSKLGRPYEFTGEQATRDQLENAALDYQENTCPKGGLLLTCGVDVQHDRLSVLLRAHGRYEESWLALWYEPAAKLACANPDDPVWDELEHIALQTPVKTEDGLSLYTAALTIDSSDGQTNDAVYSWVISMRKRYPSVIIMAGKGASSGDPEIYTTPSPRSVRPRNPQQASKADRWGLRVHIIGTSKGKDYLNGRWHLEGKGKGRHHAYSGVRVDYWDQITSEVKAPSKLHRGRFVWQQKIGARNEALDCEVYAEHARRAVILQRRLMSAGAWDGLEKSLQKDTTQGARRNARAGLDIGALKVM